MENWLEIAAGVYLLAMVLYGHYRGFIRLAVSLAALAAALLLVYGGASEVYTPMISKSAVKVFKEHNMIYSADKVVNYIVNKSGTGLCPMEKAVRNVNNPNEAYQVFKDMFTNSNHGLIQLNGQQ